MPMKRCLRGVWMCRKEIASIISKGTDDEGLPQHLVAYINDQPAQPGRPDCRMPPPPHTPHPPPLYFPSHHRVPRPPHPSTL